MEEHAFHQKCVHVLQDGLAPAVNRVRIRIMLITFIIKFKTSMSVMLIMAVITTATTLMDLMCVRALMAINYILMAKRAQVYNVL